MSAVHAEYFVKVQKALKRAGLAEPVLVVDRQRLDANISQLKTMLPNDMRFRIVAKSLPCGPLLTHIATRADTDRLMTFNAAMALQMLDLMPKADQLMGKPLPVAAVSALFDTIVRAQAGGGGATNSVSGRQPRGAFWKCESWRVGKNSAYGSIWKSMSACIAVVWSLVPRSAMCWRLWPPLPI